MIELLKCDSRYDTLKQTTNNDVKYCINTSKVLVVPGKIQGCTQMKYRASCLMKRAEGNSSSLITIAERKNYDFIQRGTMDRMADRTPYEVSTS